MSDNLSPPNILLIFLKQGHDKYSLANEFGLPIKNPAGLIQAGAHNAFIDIHLLTSLSKVMATTRFSGYSFLSSFHSPDPSHIFVVLEKNDPIPEEDFESIPRPLPEVPRTFIPSASPSPAAGPTDPTKKEKATGWVATTSRDSTPFWGTDSNGVNEGNNSKADDANPPSTSKGFYHRMWDAVDNVHTMKRTNPSQTDVETLSTSCTMGPFTQSVCDWSPTDEFAATGDTTTTTAPEASDWAAGYDNWPNPDEPRGPCTGNDGEKWADDESWADTEPVDASFYEHYYEKRSVPLPADEEKEREQEAEKEKAKQGKGKGKEPVRGEQRARRGGLGLGGGQLRRRAYSPRIVERMMAPRADEWEANPQDEAAKRRKLYRKSGGQKVVKQEPVQEDFGGDLW